jgi:hypothetical protein
MGAFGIPLTCFTPLHFCTCPKSGLGFLTSIFFFVNDEYIILNFILKKQSQFRIQVNNILFSFFEFWVKSRFMFCFAFCFCLFLLVKYKADIWLVTSITRLNMEQILIAVVVIQFKGIWFF